MLTIPELYEYSAKVRRRFATKLCELPWDDVTKNKEASFYSMKNILLHMIDNEDWMVNWGIHNKTPEYKRAKSEEYTSMKMVMDHLDAVEQRTRAYLKSADENEYNRRLNLLLLSGRTFELSVEECLFQSFTEQLYHLGELIALLWQENVEPPPMQWFSNSPRKP